MGYFLLRRWGCVLRVTGSGGESGERTCSGVGKEVHFGRAGMAMLKWRGRGLEVGSYSLCLLIWSRVVKSEG